MNRLVAYLTASLLSTVSGFAIDGEWRGELNVGYSSIPLVFHFNESDGQLACTLDSPNQNSYGIPASVDYMSSDSVSVSVNGIGAKFAGHISVDEIVGNFSQSGHKFPLILKQELPLIQRRPQTPQPPFPYQTIDTIFISYDGTPLSGSFTIPESYNKGKTKMCVLVTGSGPQNRDEEIFEHRPFAVIADFLARNGVASFRYDDRGTAESKGDYAVATIPTFYDDAKAALLFAKSFSDSPTGLIGHSEGGTISLMLAEDGLPDFVVSLAGMAISGKETVMAQNRHLLQQMGLKEDVVDNSMTLIGEIFDEIINQNSDVAAVPIDVEATASRIGVSVPPQIMQSLKGNITNTNGYFKSLLQTDVRQRISDISCPVLALNGSLDTQVSADENLQAIRQGIKNAKVINLPNLNHLFQHATTGEVKEYGEIKETISPEVLSIILSFIQNQ